MRFTYFRKKRRFLFGLLTLIFILKVSDSYFDDAIFKYVEIKSISYFEKMVNESVKEDVLSTLKGNLMKEVIGKDNKVSYVYMDVHQALEIKSKASERLQVLMEDLKEEPDLKTVEIPIGYFLSKNIILSDGINIPVRINVYEAPYTEIKTDVYEYGINSSLVQIMLNFKMFVHLQIPLQSKQIELETSILISSEIINSEVPNYYFDGLEPNPGITLSDNLIFLWYNHLRWLFMVIKTQKRYYEVLKNVKDALNIEQFDQCYIEEWYDKFPYIVGDISDGKLRLKGFTTDSEDKYFFYKIPDYILESCAYQTPYFVLKAIKESEYMERVGEPASDLVLEYEEKGFILEKIPFDKESLSLEKSKKNQPNIQIDINKLNAVTTFPLPEDLVKEIAKERAFEQRTKTNNTKNRNNRNNKRN